MQTAQLTPTFCFLFLISRAVCRWTGKIYFHIFLHFHIAVLSACDQDHSHSNDMPCAFRPWSLGINTNGRLKQEHLRSSSSYTKNIISSIPQCIWPQNLVGW